MLSKRQEALGDRHRAEPWRDAEGLPAAERPRVGAVAAVHEESAPRRGARSDRAATGRPARAWRRCVRAPRSGGRPRDTSARCDRSTTSKIPSSATRDRPGSPTEFHQPSHRRRETPASAAAGLADEPRLLGRLERPERSVGVLGLAATAAPASSMSSPGSSQPDRHVGTRRSRPSRAK